MLIEAEMIILLALLAQTLTQKDFQTQASTAFPAKSWQIENGALCSIATGPRADLSTKSNYRNFDLTFDWWLAKGTNGGVKYLVFGTRTNPDTGKFDPQVPKALGLELQLIDDEHVADAKVSPTRATGALYLFAAPPKPVHLEIEKWHKARIVVNGPHIEHWLDGVKVLEANLESAELRTAMTNEKREDIPKPKHLDELKQNPSKAYPLVLTHHGGHACYGNIEIR